MVSYVLNAMLVAFLSFFSARERKQLRFPASFVAPLQWALLSVSLEAVVTARVSWIMF